MRAQGLERVRSALDARHGKGIVILANHSCWWDLFLAHLLNETIPVDGYGMMEHFNLRRFGFFRRIGAFSVDRTDPRSVRASLDYTVALLARPRSGVWIFPQGRIASNDVRPLEMQPGLRALLRRAGQLRIVPTALRYEFWQDERPEAFVRFGRPVDLDRSDLGSVLTTAEALLSSELDSLRDDARSQDDARFTTVLEGTRSVSDRFARLHARLFGATRGAPSLES